MLNKFKVQNWQDPYNEKCEASPSSVVIFLADKSVCLHDTAWLLSIPMIGLGSLDKVCKDLLIHTLYINQCAYAYICRYI